MNTSNRLIGLFHCSTCVMCRRTMQLTLRELGAATSFAETNLLTFDFTSITGHKPTITQRLAQGFIVFNQCTGHAVTDGTCLAGDSAACDGNADVELVGKTDCLKRLAHNHAARLAAEKFVQRTAVDHDV